jgi:hypothetical protein
MHLAQTLISGYRYRVVAANLSNLTLPAKMWIIAHR